MPIYSDVITRMDERSADKTAEDLTRHFTQAGHTAGQAMSKELADALRNNPEFARVMEQYQQHYAKVAEATKAAAAEQKAYNELHAKLYAEMPLTTDRLNANTAAFLKLREAQAAEAEARRAAQATLHDYQAVLRSANEEVVKQAVAHRKALEELKKYRQEHEKTHGALKKNTEQLEALGRLSAASGIGELGESFEGLTGKLGHTAGALGILSGGLGPVGLAIGAMTVTVGAAAGAMGLYADKLYEVGNEWDEMSKRILFNTGLSGGNLSGLTEMVGELSTKTPVALGQIGDVAMHVKQSLGLTGDALSTVTQQIADFQHMAGQPIDARELGEVSRAFKLTGPGAEPGDAAKVPGLLDQMYTQYLNSGFKINDQLKTLKDLGPTLQMFNVNDAGSALGLLTQFDEAGVNMKGVGAALASSLKQLANPKFMKGKYFGQDPATFLRNVLTEVKADMDSKNDAGADNLLDSVFGASRFGGGPTIKTALTTGQLNLDAIAPGPTQSILGNAEQAMTLSDKFQMLRNTIDEAMRPAAMPLFDQLESGMGSLSKWMSSHGAEVIGFFTNLTVASMKTLDGLGAFASGFLRIEGMITQATGRMVGTVVKLFGHMVGGWGDIFKHIPGLQSLGHDLEDAGKAAVTFSDGLFHEGDGLIRLADLIDKGRGGLKGLEAGVQSAGQQAMLTAKLYEGLGDAVDKLGKDDNNVTLKVEDNTPEVQDKLRGLDMHLEQIANDPTHLKLVPDTPQAKAIIDAFRDDQSANPITPPVIPNMGPAREAMDQFLDMYKTMILTPQINGPGVSPLPPPGPAGGPYVPGLTNAQGGIFTSAFAMGGMPSSATIQSPVGPRGLIQWAEPSTGGEAYIPLRGGNRSVDIWAQTGRMLGVFDEGGFNNADPGGGFGFGNLYRMAAALAGTPYIWGTTDCSGAISELVNATLGTSGRMDTGSAASWLTSKGFLLGSGGPGTFRIAWHNGGPGGGHMAATLPDGTHFESGGSDSRVKMGAGAAGADNPEFDQHAYLPLNALFPDGRGGGGGGASPMGFGAGGAGGSGGGGFGGAGGGIPAGATPGTGPGGQPGYYAADPTKVEAATNRYLQAQERVTVANERQAEVDRDPKAKDSQRKKASDDVADAERQLDLATRELAEARQGAFHALRETAAGGRGGKSAMGELGVPLDADLGAKQGLPGLAKNLFTFLGDLAFAPVLGALSGAKAWGGDNGGRGLVGMISTAGGMGAPPSGGYGGGYGAGYGGYSPGYSGSYGGGYSGYSGGYGAEGLNAAGLGPDAAAAMSARAAAGGLGLGYGGAPGIGARGGIGPGTAAGAGAGSFPGRTAGTAGLPGAAALPGAAGLGIRPSSVIGGRQPTATLGQGGVGVSGGLISLAESLPGDAASAAGGMAPGGGAAGALAAQAAQIGIDEINRGITAGSAIGADLVSALPQTFKLNDSALGDPSNTWRGRIMQAVAGAKPSTPNMAGMSAPGQNPDGNTPKNAGQPDDRNDPNSPKNADPNGGDNYHFHEGAVQVNQPGANFADTVNKASQQAVAYHSTNPGMGMRSTAGASAAMPPAP